MQATSSVSPSLRNASNCIPVAPIDPDAKSCQDPKPPIKDCLNTVPSAADASERNVFSALGHRGMDGEPTSLLEEVDQIKIYEKMLVRLNKIIELSRSTKDLSQRSQSLQDTAKVYLEAIGALEHMPDSSGIRDQLSKDLARLLEEDLMLVYCMGYVKAEWFQDYTPYLETILKLKSLDTVTGQCLKHYYDIQSGSYQWCKAEEGSFEIQAEKMVQEQIHFLISSLQGNSGKMTSSLFLIDAYLKDLMDKYPVRLGFHSIGNVFIFLIRQGSSSAIVNFLDTYKLIYNILKKEKLNANCLITEIDSLKSTLSLCLGWRRFFSLNATHLLSICDLSDIYSMRTQPLTALYLENIKLFQAACQACYAVIQKEIQKKGLQFLSKESYMADLVSCLSIAFLTVNNWTEDTFCKLGTSSYPANISIQEDARALKSTIAEESSGLLECIAQIYLASPRQEHKQAAEAIRGFLRRYCG